jgi:hypothetical protein
MNKMTLVHIGIFTAGVVAGWMLAKSQKKDSTFANYANLTARRTGTGTGTVYQCKNGVVCKYDTTGGSGNVGTGDCNCKDHGGTAGTLNAN